MVFHGFLKLTLLDYPGHTACTVFTAGCNFRCPFCHNASLVNGVPAERYTEEDVLSYLQKRSGILDGICVTGGEPLLQPDLPAFLRKVKACGVQVKLDTNGSRPTVLRALMDEGLVDYVAMDIKNTWERYPETVGIPNFDVTDVQTSASLLLEGRVPFEFRTTVVKEFHTVRDIQDIAQTLRKAPRYYLQNFEDSGDLLGADLHAVDRQTLDAMRDAAVLNIPDTTLRGV